VSAAPDLERLSLNQITVEGVSLADAVEACARAGIGRIGLWRHKVDEAGLARAARHIGDAGLEVSSLCRGGFFAAASAAERRRRLDDNRRAVDEAVALRTGVLCLVCGPPPDRDLDGARAMVAEGVAALAPYAAEADVVLAVEPLHPMQLAERSVIVTLAEALDVVDAAASDHVAVMLDVYHLWWDPQVLPQIERARGRIAGFQVCDWLVPTTDTLLSRGLPGDGVIDIRALRAAAERAGYRGPIEVEVLNRAVWEVPAGELLADLVRRYRRHV
jgi:sugar phosphate isomerase/epimerase